MNRIDTSEIDISKIDTGKINTDIRETKTMSDMSDRYGRDTVLLGKSIDELKVICKELGMPAFKACILFHWLQQGIVDYDKMTNLSKADRAKLSSAYPLRLPEIVRQQVSRDGTTAKLLLDFGECSECDSISDSRSDSRSGNSNRVMIELVIMLYERQNSRSRHTLCVSTQAGCGMGCAFCATGLSGLMRNLSAGEIVAQVLMGQLWLQEHDLGDVTNIVFMGMGEPFANYDNLLSALSVINDENGLGIGQRRMTVSTCGLVPQIRRFADDDLDVGLAISLHAPDDELRSRLMPVNRHYPLSELLSACDYYTEKTRRRISYEYTLFLHINDSPEQARMLARLLHGRLAHINLIAANLVEETGFLPTSDERLKEFAKVLTNCGIEATVREKRGTDIDGACGQLRRKTVN